jgi:hypothetical protein
MKNSNDNDAVPCRLSEQELRQVAKYLSILLEWSLERGQVNDRDGSALAPKVAPASAKRKRRQATINKGRG